MLGNIEVVHDQRENKSLERKYRILAPKLPLENVYTKLEFLSEATNFLDFSDGEKH